MSSRTPIINNPTIIDTLREIQRREGRTGDQGGEDYNRNVPVQIIPFYEAPIMVMGVVRLERAVGRASITTGQRCTKCPLTLTQIRGCTCFNQRPLQFLQLPRGWLTD